MKGPAEEIDYCNVFIRDMYSYIFISFQSIVWTTNQFKDNYTVQIGTGEASCIMICKYKT